MKRIILIIIFSLLSTFLFCESLDNILAFYKNGDVLYDNEEYQNAIKSYEQFWKKYNSNKAIFFNKITATFEIDSNKTVKESYYSLYNIACCYSLLKDYENSEYYLKYSILAGYPYLNHILEDKDLYNLFSEKKNLKEKIVELFNLGNNPNFLIGKQIYQEGMGGLTFSFFQNKEGKNVYTAYADIMLDSAEVEYYGEGEFLFQNYKVIFIPDNYKKISRAYENNLRSEYEVKFGNNDFLWYEIGDPYYQNHFLKSDWDGFYKVEKEILIPNLSGKKKE